MGEAGISIAILVAVLAWLVMLLVELLHSERQWPVVRTWVWRALASNAIFVGVVYVAGLTWNRWLSEWSLSHLATLNVWADAAITFLVITFVVGYWWHRWRHQFPRLWLLFHQIHHSPRRLELLTTFYKHPMEFCRRR